jgi:hypothetical protein
MVEPVRLHPGEKYQESVVSVLGEILRLARDGKVRAVAISYTKTEGGTGNIWSKVREPESLLGAVHLTSIDLGMEMLKESTTTPIPPQESEPGEWGGPDNVA